MTSRSGSIDQTTCVPTLDHREEDPQSSRRSISVFIGTRSVEPAPVLVLTGKPIRMLVLATAYADIKTVGKYWLYRKPPGKCRFPGIRSSSARFTQSRTSFLSFFSFQCVFASFADSSTRQGRFVRDSTFPPVEKMWNDRRGECNDVRETTFLFPPTSSSCIITPRSSPFSNVLLMARFRRNFGRFF